MLKIFIYSNSIGTYTLLYTLESLLGSDIDTVITTDEALFKNLINNFNFKIKHFSSIEACVSNSDIVLVYNEKKLPKHIINKIKSISEIQNKKCIKIDRCENTEARSNIEYNLISANKVDAPSIVIFSVGLSTIPIKVEFDVNRIFLDVGEMINQFLSLESKHISRQFKNAKINEDRIALFDEFKQGKVSVYFFDLDNSIYNIHKYYKILTAIKPDYIIVLTDYNLLDYDELIMYIKCFCARHPDVIVKSRWFSVGNDIFCHSDNFDNLAQGNNQMVMDFEDRDFYQKLRFDIFSKITLSEGIKRIQ